MNIKEPGHIIGISGKGRSGKTTVAEYLQKVYGYEETSFAVPLKEAVIRALAKNPPPAHTELEEPAWRRLIYHDRTPFTRWLLQFIGTEIVRDEIDVEHWVKAWMKDNVGRGTKLVVPDVRFPNEVRAIRHLGGEIWRVVRTDDFGGGIESGADHRSETQLDDFTPDYLLEAPSGIENLYRLTDERMGAIAKK